jgi:ribosomal protein L12E/L44/L45/RPP1/RPP2
MDSCSFFYAPGSYIASKINTETRVQHKVPTNRNMEVTKAVGTKTECEKHTHTLKTFNDKDLTELYLNMTSLVA